MMISAIPIYVCATASIPIALALMIKGLSPGAAFVFLMAGPATNAATISTVWKVLGKKTALIYLGTVSGLSLFCGMVINLFSSEIIEHIHSHDHWMMPDWLETIFSILLLAVLFNSLFRLYFPKFFRNSHKIENENFDYKIHVSGMTCNNCTTAVKNTIFEISNVKNVDIDLASGDVKIYGQNIIINDVLSAISDVGYSAKIIKNIKG